MIATTAYNTGFAAHSIRQNASHFAKPENARRHCLIILSAPGGQVFILGVSHGKVPRGQNLTGRSIPRLRPLAMPG